MQNPYNNKAMLSHDSDMFFGREKEMKSIESSLFAENPQSVSVIGERRIGKSSVANRVFPPCTLFPIMVISYRL